MHAYIFNVIWTYTSESLRVSTPTADLQYPDFKFRVICRVVSESASDFDFRSRVHRLQLHKETAAYAAFFIRRGLSLLAS